jgi:hypothetical protein
VVRSPEPPAIGRSEPPDAPAATLRALHVTAGGPSRAISLSASFPVGKQFLGSSDYDGPMALFDRSTTPAPIVEQRRKRSRRRVLKGAQIVFAHRTSAIDCVVRDLSDSGACLKVSARSVFLTRLNFGLIRIRSVAAGWFGEKPPKLALSLPDHLAVAAIAAVADILAVHHQHSLLSPVNHHWKR